MGVTPPAEGPQKKGHATKTGLAFGDSLRFCDSIIYINIQVSLLS